MVKIRENLLSIKPYVPGKPIDEVRRELGIEGEIIKLASNENPLGPSESAIAAMKKTAEDVNLYPDGSSYSLKTAVSAEMGVPTDWIIVGNGSDEIIEIIGKTYFLPEDEIIYGNPTFSEYEYVTRLMGAQCVPVSLTDHTHDLTAMADAITEKTKAIFVCNPNNPTGTIVKGSELRSFMDRVPKDVLVVFDEAYIEFVDDPEYASGLEFVREGRNAIVMHTFSKIHGLAGLRVGYAIAAPAIISNMLRVKEPFNVNLMAQSAGVAALADKAHVEKSKALVESEKKFIYSAFESMGLEYIPSQANFVMVNVRADSKLVFNEMMKKGVILRTCDIFGMPTWIRLTYGTRKQNEVFLAAFREVLNNLASVEA